MLIDAEKTELIKNRKNTIYKEKWMEVNTDEIAKKCMDTINEKLKNLKKLKIWGWKKYTYQQFISR